MAAAPVTMPIEPTNRELEYRAKNYQDLKSIERKQIACATCGTNLSAKLERPGGVFIHPFMNTLQCKKCSDFYGDGDFSMDEDGEDKYCRMCGKGGTLFICGNKPCPYGFCQVCVDRYIGKNSSEVEADDWKCLHCNCKPLWEVRAVCAVIVLEKSKKRSKHRKKSTRGEVYDSDDDCSHSQDSNGDFENSKQLRRRPLRSVRNSKVKNKVLETLERICDNSNDSPPCSNPPSKSIAGKRDSNSKIRHIDSGANQSSVAKTKITETSRRGKELKKQIASSEDEATDLEETDIIRKKLTQSKTHKAFAEFESKSMKQQSNRNLSRSLMQQQKTSRLSQKYPEPSQSVQSSKDPRSDSDFESSNGSANEFVKSKKKKTSKTLTEKSSKTDSATQQKKSIASKSVNSKVDLKRSKNKFGNVVRGKESRESSLEPKHTNRKRNNHFVQNSSINTLRKKSMPSKMHTSESEEETDGPNKNCALGASRERTQSTDSENEKSEEDENPKSYSQVSTSSTVDKESRKAPKTMRLSIKPLRRISQVSQTPSLREYGDEFLDRKKSSIKSSHKKIAFTKDCVTMDEGRIIKDHIDKLLSEIKIFGKSVCAGANGIAAKNLTNNATSVPIVSKTVLKCALLMIRCKKSLNIIENEFVKSYENWCQSSKVESIFLDVENSDVATSNEVEPIEKGETSVNTNKKDGIRQDYKRKRSADNSDEFSDASNDYQNCEVTGSMLATENSHSDAEQKSVDENEDSNDSRSTEKIVHDVEKPANADSDGDSRNSVHDALSDCDREIFSEDECRGQDQKSPKPTTERISSPIESVPSNIPKNRSIASDSDERETLEPENSKNIEEKSSESDNMVEKPIDEAEDHREDNQEKVTEEYTEQSSRVESSIEDSYQPDLALENILENTVASDNGTTLHLNGKSKHSDDDDRTSANCSEITDQLSVTEQSAVPDVEETRYSPSDVEMVTDDDDTMDLWKTSLAKKKKSSQTSQQNKKRKISNPDSLSNAITHEDYLSDCDTIIFTQIQSEDSTSGSNAYHIAKSTDLVENSAETEDVSVSGLEIGNDAEKTSEKNDNSKDDVVSLPKEVTPSPEMIAEQHEEADDLDTEQNSKDVSNELETSEKTRDRGNVIENHSTAPSSDNRENNAKEGIDAVEEDGIEEEFEEKQPTAVDEDSEEAIKKKILESDSEWSDESAARSDSFVLKVNSDSEEYRKELILKDTAKTIVALDEPIARQKLTNSIIKSVKCPKSSKSSGPVDTYISDLNNLAKRRLLSSSSSSSSDADDIPLKLPENLNKFDSHSTSSLEENNEATQSSDTTEESTILSSSKTKKKKFNLEHNYYFKTDKKLQSCQVVVRRLNDAVLGQFSQSLAESMKRQELEDFRSLVDLNNIKKRKRGTIESNQSGSSSESSSSKGHVKKTRSKLVQEKEETLLDHLEKMNNGENYCNLSGDDTDENNDILKQIMPEGTDQDDFLKEANKLAKDLLIQSSDSENEMQPLTENAEEREQEEEPEAETEKEKQQEQSNLSEETVDSESNAENGSNTEKDNEETANVEEKVDSNENEDSDSDRTKERKKMKDGLAKRHWRLTDSDSSDEEKKWNKSQLKESDEKKTPKKEERSKNKKKVKRRVLGSDSDSTKVPDDSDDDSVEMIELKNSSSADTDDSTELFSSLRKKTRPKRNAARKTDSSSDSEQNEKPTKQRRKRIKKMESDSDSDNLTNSQDTSGKLHRKNIRKVLKDKQVADVTKMAGKEEEDRLRRIADRQKLYNEMYEIKLRNEAKVDNLILDFDEETKKVLVSVHEGLVKRLKPHQAQGIKFMWDACFESLERTKSTKGSGCIVAHCMGLGKTFQVVTLAHTLLTHPETGIKTIMVICPLSTVLNWVNEFKKWLGDINNDEDVEVFEMTKMKKNFERKYQLEKWHRAGGVMILGYEMFRLLSNQTGKKMRKSLHEGILKCLVDPGPDLIVCDEGHLLKNEDTALSKAMRRVKTLRRIVLTGTPLQNNLVEYHCMVQFVKPNLLGTKKEFLNRFVNPITNGQFDDSTEYDVKLMKKRAHVLHKMLEGSVQRFDYSVLTPFLPPKQEYVITVRLADIQITLYQHYLDHYSRKKVGAGTSLFADFQALQRIWTHPIVLRMNAEKMEKINEKKRLDASDSEGSLRDFLDDGSEDKTTSSDDSDVLSANSSSDEKTEKPEKPRRGTRANPIDPATIKQEEEELPQSGEWWSQFVEPEHFEDLRISSKLVLLFAILKESEQIGDKVLVFSQSLYALSLIEEFLNKIDDETQKGTCSELLDNHTGSWSLGLDYFRLDGQTPPENRSHYCKIFNNPKNSRARLFLISTRAGGLGINLTAANRVIIFDASWNPSHDVQSIFRIYRFGQKKPCYVYRFLAQGTMEEKIYNRQVTKLSLSCRVVDEQQIERHYSNHDLAELYQFEPNTSTEKPTLNLPKDRLLAEILRKYDDRIETLHEHDSLLENKAEEELDEEERKEAWKEYEDERTGRKVLFNNFTNQNLAIQQYNDMMNMNQADIANRATLSGINIETLQALIRKDYPNTTPEQQKMMTQRAIMDMYTYMENEAIRQQQLAAVAAANSFTYPTVSNLGTSSFVDGNNAQTAAQRQYALQQQQQQHQIRVQREQQANYAKRFGNVRGPGLSATATRPPQIINLQDDNDVIEVPTTPPPTAGPTPSSSVQTPSVSTPAVAENSKRQEE